MLQLVAGETTEAQDVQFSRGPLRSGSTDLRRVLDAVNGRHRCVYDALADEYDKKSLAHFTTTQDRVNYVTNYVQPGSKILDVGCGVGLALSMLSQHQRGFEAIGVDVSPRMAELARQRSPGTPVVLGDFLTADFGTTFDAIWEQALITVAVFRSVTALQLSVARS
jgi:SAM-dependent methyltransferase